MLGRKLKILNGVRQLMLQIKAMAWHACRISSLYIQKRRLGNWKVQGHHFLIILGLWVQSIVTSMMTKLSFPSPKENDGAPFLFLNWENIFTPPFFFFFFCYRTRKNVDILAVDPSPEDCQLVEIGRIYTVSPSLLAIYHKFMLCICFLFFCVDARFSHDRLSHKIFGTLHSKITN